VSAIVFLIEQIAPALYILIALALVLAARSWQQARHAYRSTQFGLERNLAHYQMGGALTALALWFEAGLIVVGVQQVIAPTIRADRELLGLNPYFAARQEDGIFRTPTPPPPSGTLALDVGQYDLGGEQQLEIFLTPTPIPTPPGTIESAPPVSGCVDDHAQLQIPANGMRVFLTTRVVGTAYIENFSSYTLQLSGPGTLNQFVTLDASTVPLTEVGTLSQFDPAPYEHEPGTYKFRLLVFDTTTELRAHCEVTIFISAPIPTPTPLR